MPAKNMPRHVAIVMDGNGRWAEARGESRSEGHEAGYYAIRAIVEKSAELGISALSVFAFSTENWSRPDEEVQALMALFLMALESEAESLCKNNVRLRFIGDLAAFPEKLQVKVAEVESLTENNTGLNFVVAVNYGGRWDILNATRSLCRKVKAGELDVDVIRSEDLAACLSTSEIGDPDLLIRTSGEQRISNFFLWQAAYTELYFSEKLWPDFTPEDFMHALSTFSGRDRRFGLTCSKDMDHA
ncbi:MAG: di-trans,poly-cis-decaprenylcistransferase [Gammaproteobacteria bacterium CG11_big_fil_rev_8_21_14_0_20_46_22]|nr:MAG: di-trans,poly-cis-decaprenylcistransferase [Gammaproteobacteria bacterium CG12_big_fil_rev_8_21_14_0_65_46_12]PIR11370.1 MAG: di-trans,poly-cis-decaprenylcistransferase [Gammaproteobacteria bacterium CG11_big_fil_rev_8_21_14_0_20_46_22]